MSGLAGQASAVAKLLDCCRPRPPAHIAGRPLDMATGHTHRIGKPVVAARPGSRLNASEDAL
jgi:hypothetical protein